MNRDRWASPRMNTVLDGAITQNRTQRGGLGRLNQPSSAWRTRTFLAYFCVLRRNLLCRDVSFTFAKSRSGTLPSNSAMLHGAKAILYLKNSSVRAVNQAEM